MILPVSRNAAPLRAYSGQTAMNCTLGRVVLSSIRGLRYAASPALFGFGSNECGVHTPFRSHLLATVTSRSPCRTPLRPPVPSPISSFSSTLWDLFWGLDCHRGPSGFGKQFFTAIQFLFIAQCEQILFSIFPPPLEPPKSDFPPPASN